MQSKDFLFPEWVTNAPKKEQAHARMKFVLRFAAAHATPEGSIHALSAKIGMNPNSLNAMLSQGVLNNGLSFRVINGIEKAIGRGIIPRTVMNPIMYEKD